MLNSSSREWRFLVKDSANASAVFDLASTVRLWGSPGYSRLRFGRRDAPRPVCHVATRHTHGHVHGSTTISAELVGSAPDTVHVLRFPTYVRSRVRRLNGDGVPYPEHVTRGIDTTRRSTSPLMSRPLCHSANSRHRDCVLPDTYVDKVENCFSEI